MRKLACKAVTGIDCPHTVTGPVNDSVIHNMYEHILAEHPETYGNINEEQKKVLLDKMHSLVEVS